MTASSDGNPRRPPVLSREPQSAPPAEMRRWVDDTGRYHIEAAFVSATRESVTLRRLDGLVIQVPIRRLSAADQLFMQRVAAAPPADAALLPADVVYVQVSGRMLREFLNRPIARRSAIRDTIVGTPVRGTAGTHGTIDLQLVPARGRAALDLMFHGQVHSQTTGFGGPVRVHSRGVTDFSAFKRLVIDDRGIEVLPTRVAAQTITAIHDVSTHLPRLRGWIARRIGSRRAAEMKPAAEAESSRKAEAQIAAQFDREVLNQLHDARRQWLQALQSLPIDRDLFAGRVRFSTTRDYVHLAILHTEGQLSSIRPPAPATIGSPDLAVHVHSSLVDRVVRNTKLQQSLEPFVNSLLAKEMEQLIGLVPAEPQVQLKRSPDGAWWSLVLPSLSPSAWQRPSRRAAEIPPR